MVIKNMSEEIKEEKLNSFSVVIPVHNRENLVKYSIRSVQNQMYQGDYEIIIVNDGSIDNTKEVVEEFANNDNRIKIINHETRMERNISYNDGIKAATKDFLAFCESDDEWMRAYLDSVNNGINKYPNFQCFHFGAIVCRLDVYRIREPFDLKEENGFGEAMDRFVSGRIGTGSFVYKRKIHEDIGYLPEAMNPYQFADMAKDIFPEFLDEKMYGPKYLEGGRSIGNPFGNDAFLFYAITRKFKSKMLNIFPYMNYIRRSGFWHMDADLKLKVL